MKKIITIIILFLAGICSAATITDLAGLQSYAASGGPNTIAPGTYILDADLVFTVNGTLTHNNTTGDVIIDGNNLFKASMRDCTATFSGISPTKRIIFQRGDDYNLLISSTSAITNITFNYCDANDSNSIDGLSMKASTPPVANMTVTCNNCNVYNSAQDGFSIEGGATTKFMVLNLNDCTAYDNGTGVAHQGVTALSPLQYINIVGGSYYDNAGQGSATIGGSSFYANGATFYGNGSSSVMGADASPLTLKDCVFHSGKLSSHISYTGTSFVMVDGCLFRDNLADSTAHAINFYSGSFQIINSIFDSVGTGTYKYCINPDVSAVGIIKNNTFYNCATVLHYEAYPILFTNNIIHTTSNYAIYTAAQDAYKYAMGNNYNYFYNCSHDFYDDVGFYTNQSHSTDVLDIDPQFVDAAGGDFNTPYMALSLPDGSYIGAIPPTDANIVEDNIKDGISIKVNGESIEGSYGWVGGRRDRY